MECILQQHYNGTRYDEYNKTRKRTEVTKGTLSCGMTSTPPTAPYSQFKLPLPRKPPKMLEVAVIWFLGGLKCFC
jgi:hypothetical protein